MFEKLGLTLLFLMFPGEVLSAAKQVQDENNAVLQASNKRKRRRRRLRS